jgi:hypothetical protein
VRATELLELAHSTVLDSAFVFCSFFFAALIRGMNGRSLGTFLQNYALSLPLFSHDFPFHMVFYCYAHYSSLLCFYFVPKLSFSYRCSQVFKFWRIFQMTGSPYNSFILGHTELVPETGGTNMAAKRI